MKKTILTPLAFALLLFYCASCAPDFDFDGSGYYGSSFDGFNYSTGGYSNLPPGIPATFTIHEPDSTSFMISGDAYFDSYGFYNSAGSTMLKRIDPYDSTYFYELVSTSSYESNLVIYFDFYSTSLGQPLDSITTGMYYAHNATYSHGDKRYEAFHYSDADINQQLHAVIYVREKKEGRITGSFTGKYYQPETGEIVTITGEFTNVYVYN